MRRMISFVGVIVAGASMIKMVWINGADPGLWTMASYAPFLLLASFFVYFRMDKLQSFMVPFLIFYGAGNLMSLPRSPFYLFGLAMASIMLVMAVYILLIQILRLRLISTTFSIIFGLLVFFTLEPLRNRFIEEPEQLASLRESEATLFFK